MTVVIQSEALDQIFKDLLDVLDVINAFPIIAEALDCLEYDAYEDKELNQQGRKFVVACFKQLLAHRATEIEFSLADIRDRLLVIKSSR